MTPSAVSRGAARVSIVHWNRPAECVATVAALRQQSLVLDITVVDNNSEPSNVARLAAALPSDVELIRLHENVGWGRAHNVVLRRWLDEETSEFCVVSAHDALPGPNGLPLLFDALKAHPRWGMACPESGVAEVPRYSVLRGARTVPVPARTPGTHEEVEFCHGTLAVFRRACLREIGIFDEYYFAYGDETEIGLRARRRGWLVGKVWGSVVVNPGSWSGDAVIGYLWTRNGLRLAKSEHGFTGLFARGLCIAGATVRLWMARASATSLSSPRARWLGIRDYLRHYTGAPPVGLAQGHDVHD